MTLSIDCHYSIQVVKMLSEVVKSPYEDACEQHSPSRNVQAKPVHVPHMTDSMTDGIRQLHVQAE